MCHQQLLYLVRLNGCVRLELPDMQRLWPSAHGWNQAAAEAWCQANRIDMHIDDIMQRAYFNPAGIDAPLACSA